ncbi:MAG: ATP-binding cassette domain-containing protein [Enterococcus aquimarinus]|uniref:ATP-binding cassette domain-containing protein n=1 Tax=Enterococcus aquimarinus TaxID=328396 RepID=A0A9E3ZUX2_9ENTE|nr:ATP-binding cassette domain-containing protein [Enterococcus aquimarinus]
MLKISNLTVSYKKQQVLNDLTLTLKKGDVLGLIAPNGSGKTTFLNSIVGLIPRESGSFILNHSIAYEKQREAYLKEIFFLENSQNLYPDLTVQQHLEMVKELWQSTVSITDTLNIFHINRFQHKKVRQLSLGMKQQLLLSLYYISDARVLLFDEPLNGLDPTNIQLFNALIQSFVKRGKTIIMSSHNLGNVAELCTKVAFLHEGKLHETNSVTEDLQEQYNQLFNGSEVFLNEI